MSTRSTQPKANPATIIRRGTAKRRPVAADSGGTEADRQQMIAEAAYYRAEQRGFAPGHEMADWLLAEADVERALGPSA